MKNIIVFGVLTGGLYFVFRWYKQQRYLRRKQFIEEFAIPLSIAQKVKDKYPHLSDSDLREVMGALKVYFHICNLAGQRMVSMPSQVVDVAWHELILFTRQYQLFCQKAFGRFLHHVPAEAMPTPLSARVGIQRAWRLSCKREKLDPLAPSRLPILFALDAKLGITDGFFYSTDCTRSPAGTYCTTDIGCGGSGCSAIGSSCAGDSGCSSGCGGGCGGGD